MTFLMNLNITSTSKAFHVQHGNGVESYIKTAHSDMRNYCERNGKVQNSGGKKESYVFL